MSRMLRASGLLGLATLGSRVLGLVREQVYAHFMGDTPVASAFKLAFQIPNLFRRLLGEGALTAAFIPIFKRKETTEGEAAMWQAANATASGLVIVTTALVGLAVVGLSVVLAAGQVGWTQDGQPVFPPFPIPLLSEHTVLVLRLLRLMFPYLILVCLAALCMGILNARGYFFIPAMGATLLNVVMIASVLLLAPRFGETLETQVFALGVGVLVAGFAQFAFQVPTLLRQGFRYRWVAPWGNPTLRELVRKMIPATIGVAAFQVNVLLIMVVSYWVDKHVVASFDYAVRLMEFPQGIVGISLATYLLPTLSGLAAEKNYGEFRATLRQGLGYMLYLNLLASVLLMILAEPMVRLLFERGAFSMASTQRTSSALLCLAPGLVAFSGVNLLARAFYALGDTKTPMRVSVFCLAANLFLSLWLVGPLRQAGLGAANSLTAALNCWLLGRALRRKLKTLELGELRAKLVSLLGATVVAGGVAWGLLWLWQARLGHGTLLLKLGEVFVPALAAALAYWGVTLWLRVPEASEAIRMLRRRAQRGEGGGEAS
ncbi:MAG: murein biosynthesis integral membrane protein MurJ [Verrucomicrobiales bacterium]|nr:murein biosynthesis integral membrane protein MurJ [Verrucomicrobiales bacterium]